MRRVGEINEILGKHKEELRERFSVKEIGIFGSYVRGENRKRSDLGQKVRVASPLGRLRRINPDSIEWLKKRDIDLQKKGRIEIAPSLQHQER